LPYSLRIYNGSLQQRQHAIQPFQNRETAGFSQFQ
jgi:hypothetical protein